jgi:hypothetical protein
MHAGHVGILDLLVDGSSSFAALYASMRLLGYFPLGSDIGEVLYGVVELEQLQLLTLEMMTQDGSMKQPTSEEIESARQVYEHWLPNATFEECAIDEVGIWCEITDRGRSAWEEETRRATEG